MSDDINVYVLYLNEAMTSDRIESMYAEIRDDEQGFSISLPFDEMMEFTLNVGEYHRNRKVRGWGEIGIDDSVTVEVLNCDLGKGPGFHSQPPHLARGERQMKLTFYSSPLVTFKIVDEPELGSRIMSLLTTIARCTDPFFGMYLWGAWYLDETLWGEEVAYLERLFKSGRHTSFYCDRELCDAIGYDVLNSWAGLMTPVDDMGFFVEIGDMPLDADNFKDRRDLYKQKVDIYIESIYPKIIERLRKEYGEKLRRIGELGIEYYRYSP